MDAEERAVPRSLRVAAALSWRVLLVATAVAVVALLLARLRLVVLPAFAALVLATVLVPPANRLRARGWPASLATAAVVLGALVLVGGVATALAPALIDDLDELDVSVGGGVDKLETWLSDGPFGLSGSRAEDLVESAREELASRTGVIVGGALGGAVLALEVIAGVLLTLVLLFFFVRDGDRLWSWVVGLAPAAQRRDVQEIGVRAWTTLGRFLRGTALVALVDAVFIGLGLFLLGVPFVIPLAVLTFFGAFIPVAGAVVAGFVAVMVALVSDGLVTALAVVALVVAVQQLEGNLLQPLVVGRAVALHPVAVLLAVTAGAVVWGIAGAFVAVPLTAVAAQTASYLRSRPRLGALPSTATTATDVEEARASRAPRAQ